MKSNFNPNWPLMENIESIRDSQKNFTERNIKNVLTVFHPFTDIGEEEYSMIKSFNLTQ